MLVIGEKINASSRSVGEAIAIRNSEFVEGLARAQAAAGADFIMLTGSDPYCKEYIRAYRRGTLAD